MREGYNHFKLTRGELAWAVGSRAGPLSVHGRQSSTSRVVGCGHLRSVSPFPGAFCAKHRPTWLVRLSMLNFSTHR